MPVRSAQHIWRQMSHVLGSSSALSCHARPFPLRHFQGPTGARSSLPSRRTCPACRSQSGTFSVSAEGLSEPVEAQTLKLTVCFQVCTRWWSSCCRSAWSCWCSAGSSALSVRWSASPECWWDLPPTSSSAVSPEGCPVGVGSGELLLGCVITVGRQQQVGRDVLTSWLVSTSGVVVPENKQKYPVWSQAVIFTASGGCTQHTCLDCPIDG